MGQRLRRHVYWARRDGLGRVIEEDDLNPRERLSTAWRKYRWRSQHGVTPGTGRAVFLVGLQRSGTNMVVKGLEHSPAVELHNENDRRVFDRFQLRSDAIVRETVLRSRHQIVLFKPLSDSHNTVHLLEGLGLPTAPRAIWAYRNVDDRVRSAVAKFGDVNRRVLIEIAEGRAADRWQAQGLSDETLDLVRRCDPQQLSTNSAAALFWVVRNGLFFEQQLQDRSDVHLVSYERVISEPEDSMRTLAAFVGLPYSADLAAHIDGRASGERAPLDLDPQVRAAADTLAERLDEVERARHARTV